MKSKLKELQAQRVDAEKKVASARHAVEEAGDDVTDGQLDALDEAIKGFEAVDVDIQTINERQAKLDRAKRISESMDEPDEGSRTAGSRGAGWNAGKERIIDHPLAGYGHADAPEESHEAKVARGAFLADVRMAARGDVSDKLRNWDNAMKAAAGTGVTGLTGPEGGYLVPAQMNAMMDKSRIEASVVRPRATVIQMSSNRVTFPWLDDSTHASTVFGGVAAYFKGEEDQFTSSRPKFEDRELIAHKLTTLCYVTGEMLNFSAISLGSWLPQKMGMAMGWKEDQKHLAGTGAGEPLGILNADCAISITKETGQAASTIVMENVIKQDARLWDYGGRLGWIANRTSKVQLAQMYIAVGTGGVPVFLPANASGTDGLGPRPLQTLYGYPIVFTEHVPTLGSAGDLTAVNFSEYIVGDVVGAGSTDVSIHLKFDYDQTAYRVITYVAGMCPWRTAFTPTNGDTLSPVVKIAVRS